MHSFSKVLTHFFCFGVRSRWRISQTNVCSMLRKIRFLDFTSGSSLATSFQKRKNALFPLRSAFTLAGYRLRLSPYVKSAKKARGRKSPGKILKNYRDKEEREILFVPLIDLCVKCKGVCRKGINRIFTKHIAEFCFNYIGIFFCSFFKQFH